jgi:hypothetical protein
MSAYIKKMFFTWKWTYVIHEWNEQTMICKENFKNSIQTSFQQKHLMVLSLKRQIKPYYKQV